MFKDYFAAKYGLEKGCTFNIFFSDRSDGKTFDCKARALDNYFNGGWQSVYLRRFKTEITSRMYLTYFNEILKIEPYKARYGHFQFKGDKNGIQVSQDNGNTWDYIVYFLVLTMSSKLKSQLDISRIRNIDFDEYIPLDNRYLPNEMDFILELYKSIDRDRDIVQFNFFGNKIAYYCPILDYFKIELSLAAKEGIRCYKNNSIMVQIYASKEHRDTRKKSKFQDAIAGTQYEEYSNGGVLNILDLSFKAIQPDYKRFASFITERGEGAIYFDNDYNYIVSTKKIRNTPVIVLDTQNDEREQINIKFGTLATNLKNAYRLNHIFFEDTKSFYIFEPMMEKIR